MSYGGVFYYVFIECVCVPTSEIWDSLFGDCMAIALFDAF